MNNQDRDMLVTGQQLAKLVFREVDVNALARKLVAALRKEAKEVWGFSLTRPRWVPYVEFVGRYAHVTFSCAAGSLRFIEVDFDPSTMKIHEYRRELL